MASNSEDFLAETLRSPEWMELHQAVVGGTVWMDIEEVGIAGYARVLAIEAAPKVEEGPGCVVLSRFTRQNDNLMELQLGSGETLELTDTHLLYSASRDRWVAAGALWEGEYLQGAFATVPVLSIEALDGKRQVFNVEVETAHRYVVGDTGVLAHNSDGGCGETAAPHGQGSAGPSGTGDSIDGGDGPAGNTTSADGGQGSQGLEGASAGAKAGDVEWHHGSLDADAVRKNGFNTKNKYGDDRGSPYVCVSADCAAARDAINPAIRYDAQFADPSKSGIVSGRMSRAEWDGLHQSGDLSTNSYGGFGHGLATTETKAVTPAGVDALNRSMRR